MTEHHALQTGFIAVAVACFVLFAGVRIPGATKVAAALLLLIEIALFILAFTLPFLPGAPRQNLDLVLVGSASLINMLLLTLGTVARERSRRT